MLEWLDDRLDIESLMWLYPVALLLRDAEEIAMSERWMRAHQKGLSARIAGDRIGDAFLGGTDASTGERAATALLLLTLAVLLTRAASRPPAPGLRMSVFVGAVSILFLNVFTHVGQTLVLGMYTPGVLAAVLVALPYTLYVYDRLLKERLISWSTLGLSVLLGGLVMLPLIGFAQAAGRFIAALLGFGRLAS